MLALVLVSASNKSYSDDYFSRLTLRPVLILSAIM